MSEHNASIGAQQSSARGKIVTQCASGGGLEPTMALHSKCCDCLQSSDNPARQQHDQAQGLHSNTLKGTLRSSGLGVCGQ